MVVVRQWQAVLLPILLVLVILRRLSICGHAWLRIKCGSYSGNGNQKQVKITFLKNVILNPRGYDG